MSSSYLTDIAVEVYTLRSDLAVIKEITVAVSVC